MITSIPLIAAFGGHQAILKEPSPPKIQPRFTVQTLQVPLPPGCPWEPQDRLQGHLCRSVPARGRLPESWEAAHLPCCQGCWVATRNKPLSSISGTASSWDWGQRKEMSRKCRQMMGASIWDGKELLIWAKLVQPCVCVRWPSLEQDPKQIPLSCPDQGAYRASCAEGIDLRGTPATGICHQPCQYPPWPIVLGCPFSYSTLPLWYRATGSHLPSFYGFPL